MGHQRKISVGDIITFKGSGATFKILSFLLGLFDKEWRGLKWKPWHTSIASRKLKDGWMIIEAVQGGVSENFYFDRQLEDTRSYTWLSDPPTEKKMNEFRKMYLGYPYDVTAYFGITLAYLWYRITGKNWRVIDTEHLCWETVAAFCRFMGKPLQPIWEYPILPRLIRKLERR